MNLKFQELKTILKNIKSQKNGRDLYSHLQSVIGQLIQHYPNQAFDKLEEVSYLLKHDQTYELDSFLKVDDFRDYRSVCMEMEAFIKEMRYQYGAKPPVPEGEEEAEPEDIPAVGYVPDLV